MHWGLSLLESLFAFESNVDYSYNRSNTFVAHVHTAGWCVCIEVGRASSKMLVKEKKSAPTHFSRNDLTQISQSNLIPKQINSKQRDFSKEF